MNFKNFRLIYWMGAVLSFPLFSDLAIAQQTAPPAASPPMSIGQADLEAFLDGYMPFALARGDIAGAVVSVVQNGRTVLEKGFGWADVEKKVPVSADRTLFRPGSVSKLFTWTSVIQLVESGQLDLDADINEYLDFTIPTFKGGPVTLRQMMTHTAGFEESLRYLIGDDPSSVQPLGTILQSSMPARIFAAGTTPAYSNYATALAGYIVERVTGLTFSDYVQQRIFAPLAMEHSSFEQPLPSELLENLASGYSMASQPPMPFEMVELSPAGGLSATGSDMARFMIAHLDEDSGLLSPDTMAEMQTTQDFGISGLNRMTLGFFEQHVNGNRALAHGGDLQFFHAYLWIFPEAELGVFIAFNSTGTPGSSEALTTGLIQGFADRYLPERPLMGSPGTVGDMTAAEMMVGNYVASRGSRSNFLQILDLMGSQVSVTADSVGELKVSGLIGMGGEPRIWTPAGGSTWVDIDTGERLVGEIVEGRVTRFSADPFSPFLVYSPVLWTRDAAWLLPVTLGSLAATLLIALAWPVNAAVRWRYGAPFAPRGWAAAYRSMHALAVMTVAVAVGWVIFVQLMLGDLSSAGGSLDPVLQVLQVLTPVVLITYTVAAFWSAIAGWSSRPWWSNVVAVITTSSALMLLYVACTFGLVGLNSVY